MAPCSDRQMPSSLPAFRAASTIMSRIVSQHSRVSLPEGVALAAPAHTGCQPCFFTASIQPPISFLVPVKRGTIASPSISQRLR